jgi:uncharacterized membrane protein
MASRHVALDRLRGLIIVLMALDHVRDFFGDDSIDAMDAEHASVALFATRWITHLCAPGFVFLAGTSAYLYKAKHGDSRTARFLLSRGLWLIFLELSVVHIAWFWPPVSIQWNRLMVLWALGGSMILLAPLARAPRWVPFTLALVIVLGHNLLDGVHADRMGALGWAWTLFHEPGWIALGESLRLGVLYPLLPWTGVMLLGFAFGPQMLDDHRRTTRRLGAGGLALLVAFVGVRLAGLGDPAHWTLGATPAQTAMSFLNVEKYPPSLCFVLATLGVLALILAWMSRRSIPSSRDPLLVFGRVPMFFYVIHIYLIHLAARVVPRLARGVWLGPRETPGWGLPRVYLAWLVVLLVLYPVCARFGQFKATHRAWWITYV